jgi:phosphonate transport system substrate-binding protein
MKLSKWSMLISMALVAVLLLSACGGGAEPQAPEPTEPPPPTEAPEPADTPVPPTPTPMSDIPTPAPTDTPAGTPLGSEGNPIVIAGVDISSFSLHSVVGDLLMEETGYTIESPAFASDGELVNSLAGGDTPHAIIAFPAGYLVAHEQYGYEAALTGTQLGGQLGYTAEVIAGADTGITSLLGVAGRSVCWGNPESLTGYKVQRLMLWAEGIDPQTGLGEETELMTHDMVTTAVYNGDCEVGAIYGGARSRLEARYPDVLDRVLVIAESPLIPSVSLSFASGVPTDVQEALIEGFRAVAGSDDGAQALQMGYGWDTVEEVDDSLYEPLRELIRAAKAELDALL